MSRRVRAAPNSSHCCATAAAIQRLLHEAAAPHRIVHPCRLASAATASGVRRAAIWARPRRSASPAKHRPQATLPSRQDVRSVRQLMEIDIANCSLSILTGGAAARSSAASPSADTTQQAAPSPPNAGAVCRHRSATARLEHTQQRNRHQLLHLCRLSATSRSHRA